MDGTVLLVALFGALGSLARYGVGVAWQTMLGEKNVFGTLTVNVVGCLLMGLLAAATYDEQHLNMQRARAILGVGFLGGFTTFSAFGQESFALWEKYGPLSALGNIGANVVIGLCAVAVGMLIGRRIWGT